MKENPLKKQDSSIEQELDHLLELNKKRRSALKKITRIIQNDQNIDDSQTEKKSV